MIKYIAAVIVAAVLAFASARAEENSPPVPDITDFDSFVIRRPLASLGLDPFYRKYVDAGGIPVIASDKVPDTALLLARDIILYMLSDRRDVRNAMIKSGFKVGIMAVEETTIDLPEQRDWKKPAFDDPRLTAAEQRTYNDTIAKMTDREYWAKRARGMGGLPYTTGATENIIGIAGTKYYGENIFVHEFSHAIMETLAVIDPKLVAAVKRAYAHAHKKKLWQCAYMDNNPDEYWAEGTQFWFNSNFAYINGEAYVSTADEFRARDPELYNILAKVYRPDHHILADTFYMHPARLKPKPFNRALDCR